jgi:hypothetical protein
MPFFVALQKSLPPYGVLRSDKSADRWQGSAVLVHSGGGWLPSCQLARHPDLRRHPHAVGSAFADWEQAFVSTAADGLRNSFGKAVLMIIDRSTVAYRVFAEDPIVVALQKISANKAGFVIVVSESGRVSAR